MRRLVWITVAISLMLAVAGCSNAPPPASAPTAVAAPAQAAPTALAAPPAPVPPAIPAPPDAKLAAIEPAEVQLVMAELSLAHALDVCGFPTLGQFIRDYTQQKVESCPNSAARKAALRGVVDSAALHEKRLADQARAQGDAPRCQETDKLTLIKEMIPVAQRVVATADKPLDCSRISRAEP